MKIVVIGGTGLIGSRLVKKLREHGHEAVAASPSSGINTLTCEGLAEVLKGVAVVVDVTNSPSWEDAAVMKFFVTSTRNLLTYEAAAGVGHHVALSVVGTERMLESGFFRAKMAQENLIKDSSIPYSIIRATQFFEFVKAIADLSTEGNEVRLPPVLFQPMAADDVASAVGRVATGSPVNGTVEVGGPEQFRLDEAVRRGLAARKDPRKVISDLQARYYGIKVSERTLIPNDGARLGETRFETWLTQSVEQNPSRNAQSAAKTAGAPTS
ncbi:MAG TPA: SDR family oxidoreductase [Terriglobia bacterium]|nr:SDR family oxidoreductase [Terriglobia bacterium]